MAQPKHYKPEAVVTARIETEVEKPSFYLTFDDGPNGGTRVVLDALRPERVHATFFMNAINMTKNRSEQYALVKQMIEDGHALADHGYDHDPQNTLGYSAAETSAVKADFTSNRIYFQELFKDHKEDFPGFVAARLPGDGRNFPQFVKMITDEVQRSHVSWDYEFSPAGVFKGREKRPLLEEHKLDDSKSSDVNASEQIKRENEQIRAENAKIKAANEKRDFYPNWIAGVSAATLRPDQWPAADSIVLLHDAQWSNKSELLKKLIQRFKEKRTIAHLVPLPHHKKIREAAKPGGAGTKPAELFFVQIGSMSSEPPAAQLKAKAIAAGHANTAVTAENKHWRVQIGPYESMQAAREASVQIAKAFPGAFPVSQ